MTVLNLEQARAIISAGFAAAAAAEMQPLAILVLDAGGHPLAFEPDARRARLRHADVGGQGGGATSQPSECRSGRGRHLGRSPRLSCGPYLLTASC